MTTLEAIYQNGVFRPLGEVKLPENQRVQVLVPTEAPPTRPRSLRDLLGLLETDGPPPTDEECERLLAAELLRKYGP
jgi:predicted DNA-binding antitoxin AbrB/MazE fold protein